MRTKVANRRARSVVDDDVRPDTSHLDWTTAEVGRRARKPGDKTEIRLDGAVEYQLRLIPSAKVIGRFASTLDAWPAIIAAAESGRSLRTLSLDAIGPAGKRWHMAAGPFLLAFARLNNGEPHPYADRAGRSPHRAAKTA